MNTTKPQTPVTNKALTQRYQRAQQFESAAIGFSTPVLNDRVVPHWITPDAESPARDQFWYIRKTRLTANPIETLQHDEADSPTLDHTTQFRIVDAANACHQEAFDHQALAAALGASAGEAVDPNHLPFSEIELQAASAEPSSSSPHFVQVGFEAYGQRWIYKIEEQVCEPISNPPANWSISPDGKKAVFTREHNLWLRDLTDNSEKALTHDGEPFYVYASTSTVYGRQEAITLEAIWSSDSQQVLTHVSDTRQVKIAPPLVRHVPPNGELRPDIIGPNRRMALPGDEHIEGHYFVAIHIESGVCTTADYPLCPTFAPPYVGFFSGGRGWWSPDNRRAYFVDLSRDGLTGRLLEFDTATGATRTLIEETATARFNFIPSSHLGVVLKVLPGGRELVWYSERSGWAHLYLYNLDTGELKNAITQGDYMVRNILHVDAERRELMIQTAGREAGRNAYYRDICRVNIDTGALTTVLSSDHEYFVCDPQDRGCTGTSGVAPSGNFLVATRSREDQMPVSLLLDRQGDVVIELEVADIAGLPANWQWPEPVALKAADGQTDIYGTVFRPTDFSPEKSYPVLDFSSFGDFISAGSFGGSVAGYVSYIASAYAELGFIVVMLRARGSSLRSIAFRTDIDTPMYCAWHQDDCMAGIRQLAERYPYMDTERVGLGGYTSPSSAITGILKYPDFYTVAVSSNSIPEIQLVWNGLGETTCTEPMPCEDFFDYDALATHLSGKLLLIIGMLDNVAPPAGSFRVVEALRKANRDFDMLVLPNYGHAAYSSYVTRRTWDYFVRHLLQLEPPKSFALPSSWDLDDSTMIEN